MARDGSVGAVFELQPVESIGKCQRLRERSNRHVVSCFVRALESSPTSIVAPTRC
jgi:hypothetical protein